MSFCPQQPTSNMIVPSHDHVLMNVQHSFASMNDLSSQQTIPSSSSSMPERYENNDFGRHMLAQQPREFNNQQQQQFTYQQVLSSQPRVQPPQTVLPHLQQQQVLLNSNETSQQVPQDLSYQHSNFATYPTENNQNSYVASNSPAHASQAYEMTSFSFQQAYEMNNSQSGNYPSNGQTQYVAKSFNNQSFEPSNYPNTVMTTNTTPLNSTTSSQQNFEGPSTSQVNSPSGSQYFSQQVNPSMYSMQENHVSLQHLNNRTFPPPPLSIPEETMSNVTYSLNSTYSPQLTSPPAISPPNAAEIFLANNHAISRRRSASDPTALKQKPTTLKARKKRSCTRWTDEENKKLIEAYVMNDGKNWSSISRHVGNKTSDQCNQHWHRVLNPAISKKPWTDDEDQVLVRRVRDFGESSWKKISDGLTGRTDLQCRHRWTQLKKNLSPRYGESSEIATPESPSRQLVLNNSPRSSPYSSPRQRSNSFSRRRSFHQASMSPESPAEVYPVIPNNPIQVVQCSEYYDASQNPPLHMISQQNMNKSEVTDTGYQISPGQYEIQPSSIYQSVPHLPGVQYTTIDNSPYNSIPQEYHDASVSSPGVPNVAHLSLEGPLPGEYSLIQSEEYTEPRIYSQECINTHQGYFSGFGLFDPRQEETHQILMPPHGYVRETEEDTFPLSNTQFD